jgi:disulfide oxidoreductase YuzD
VIRLELHEYVTTYIDTINEMLKKLFPDYEEECSQSTFLLMQEEKIAEQDWFDFVNEYKRRPERADLFENVHRFGLNRADLFDNNTREIEKKDFVDFYLKEIKQHEFLVKGNFQSTDLNFILERERYIISRKFDEHCVNHKGYEELNIASSKKTQEWLLKAMVLRFEQDFESFYIGLQSW